MPPRSGGKNQKKPIQKQMQVEKATRRPRPGPVRMDMQESDCAQGTPPTGTRQPPQVFVANRRADNVSAAVTEAKQALARQRAQRTPNKLHKNTDHETGLKQAENRGKTKEAQRTQ